MTVRASERQQRVVGQLVLSLRESRLLVGARDVEYELNDQGVVTVDWVEGPCANEVADGLVAYSAAGLVALDAVAGTGNNLRADLLLSGVPVVLMAQEPIGLERASRVGRLKRSAPEWRWPMPLEEEGAARDTVLWTLDRDHGTVATVVRLPIDLSDDWSESGTLVVLPEEDAPTGMWLSRRQEVDRAREKCSILLRVAPRGWTVDDADDWMAEELDNKNAPRLATAVALPDRCLLRRSSGLRIEAMRDSTCGIPWSYVPTALLASIWHPKPCRKQPPASLKVRVFGDVFTVDTISASSTWCVPSRQYR